MTEAIGVFALGSLANTGTIKGGVKSLKPSRVAGYRRGWVQPVTHHGIEYSVLGALEGTAEDAITGATIHVDAPTLLAIMEREAGYRIVLTKAHPLSGAGAAPDLVAVCETRKISSPSARIPMSYLVTVLEGFGDPTLFGAQGFETFVSNTEGWERGVFCDYDRCLYPRAVENYRELGQALEPKLAEFTNLTR